jgi:hypothetical protein
MWLKTDESSTRAYPPELTEFHVPIHSDSIVTLSAKKSLLSPAALVEIARPPLLPSPKKARMSPIVGRRKDQDAEKTRAAILASGAALPSHSS